MHKLWFVTLWSSKEVHPTWILIAISKPLCLLFYITIFKIELPTELKTSYCTFDITSDYEYVGKHFKTWMVSQVLGSTDPLNPGCHSGFSSIQTILHNHIVCKKCISMKPVLLFIDREGSGDMILPLSRSLLNTSPRRRGRGATSSGQIKWPFLFLSELISN